MYMDLVVDYGQVMAEYFLIAETSAVTLTIAGVIKEVVTIVVSSLTCPWVDKSLKFITFFVRLLCINVAE